MKETLTLPHSPEMERVLLASFLVDPDLLEELFSSLEEAGGEALFHLEVHRRIYRALLGLWDEGRPLELPMLWEVLKDDETLLVAGGMSYLASLAEEMTVAAYAPHYAEALKELYLRRRLIGIAQDLARRAYEKEAPPKELADWAVSNLRHLEALGHGEVRSIGEGVGRVLAEAAGELPPPEALPTGFKDLDRLLGGMRPGNLWVVAARPSMGKTALALNIAVHVAVRERAPVLFFSLEMPEGDLTARALAAEARVPLEAIRRPPVAEEVLARLASAASRLEGAPLYLDDTPGLSVALLKARARGERLRKGIRLIVVDYLQFLTPGSVRGRRPETRQEEVAVMVQELKRLARELEVPVLVLSQLSRMVETGPDKRPRLSHLRESGAIEQEADVVLGIYRDEYYNPGSLKRGIAEVLVLKNRNGPTGVVELQYHAEHVRFNDLAQPQP